MKDLNYEDPKDLAIKKMHEIIYGVEWFENEKNKETYKKEVQKIINAK